MANRHILALSKLDNFKDFLVSIGYEIVDSKGFYEVLRAFNPSIKRTVIVYRRDSAKSGLIHLSVLDKDIDLVNRFIKERKEKK